jgi:hypothetical protein
MVCGDSVGVSVAVVSGGGAGPGCGVMTGTVVDSGVDSSCESTGCVGVFGCCRSKAATTATAPSVPRMNAAKAILTGAPLRERAVSREGRVADDSASVASPSDSSASRGSNK